VIFVSGYFLWHYQNIWKILFFLITFFY
jgi:hypothetical protein